MGLMDKEQEGEELVEGRGGEGGAHGSVMWECDHHMQGDVRNMHRQKP